MTEEIRVKALRTFEGEEGFKTPGSEPFTVGSRRRLADLKANGLVEELDGEAAVVGDPGAATGAEGKKAPSPANKKAPEPNNKAA